MLTMLIEKRKQIHEFNKKIQIGGAGDDDVDEEKEGDGGDVPLEESDIKKKPEPEPKVKKASYSAKEEKSKFEENNYDKLGEGDDLRYLGEKDKKRAKEWWDDLGFTLFNEYISNRRTKQYLESLLEEKNYNMTLLINDLCEAESLEDNVCKIRDITSSVEDVLKIFCS